MRSRGFTIIETLVYLALFALLLGGIVSASFLLMESSGRNQTKAMMQEEKDFLVAKINEAMSGAQSVSTPSANASAASLAVTKYGGTTAAISLASGRLVYNGANISNTNVTVSNLVFIHAYQGGANPESVEAGFTISAKTPNGATVTQIATTTRYVRK
jgi:Tfp pilus assembly protein PilE